MPARKIVLTGGTSGIGHALAGRLAFRHDLLVTGRMPDEAASALLPSNCLYCQAPLDDPEAAAQAIAKRLLEENWSRLDHVILNAGTGFVARHGIDTVENIRATLDVNLVSSLLLARTLYPWLAKSNGTLTFVGSVAHKGNALIPAYAASKAGLHGLARALRSEWRGTVNIQIVHPGPTNTPMHDKAGLKLNWVRDLFIKPDQMAAMIEYAITRRRSPQTLSFFRYLNGGTVLGRPLR